MTEVMQVREAYRVEQWRQLMQQRKDSPLNNREFCAQQGISEKSYYYWLKKLRESAMERGIPQLVALEDREKPDELRIEYHGASMVLPGHVDIDAVAASCHSNSGRNCVRTACFCFAGGGQTGSKRCISQGMGMYCSTSG